MAIEIESKYAILYRQKPPHPKTGQVHHQAKDKCFANLQLIETQAIQHKTFDDPDKDLCHTQCDQIMVVKKIQCNPQEGLGDQIYKDTCDEYRTNRLPLPNGVAETNHTFYEERDGKGLNHFSLRNA